MDGFIIADVNQKELVIFRWKLLEWKWLFYFVVEFQLSVLCICMELYNVATWWWCKLQGSVMVQSYSLLMYSMYLHQQSAGYMLWWMREIRWPWEVSLAEILPPHPLIVVLPVQYTTCLKPSMNTASIALPTPPVHTSKHFWHMHRVSGRFCQWLCKCTNFSWQHECQLHHWKVTNNCRLTVLTGP